MDHGGHLRAVLVAHGGQLVAVQLDQLAALVIEDAVLIRAHHSMQRTVGRRGRGEARVVRHVVVQHLVRDP
eukprot:2307885-Prymnesium_polylepis.1